jgi:hypothetical protein
LGSTVRAELIFREPCSQKADAPNFDIAWIDGSRVFVGEVKSMTPDNEEEQLRLALGQVLRYEHQVSQYAQKAHSARLLPR